MTNPFLRRLLAALALSAGPGVATQAPVWQCRAEDGSLLFSDKPCPGRGKPVEARRLQGNVADAPRLPAPAEPQADVASTSAPPGNDCPGDLELRNMEMRANSRGLGDREKAFMQDEIRRVRQCRKGQGRYTAADWAISREAQAALPARLGGPAQS